MESEDKVDDSLVDSDTCTAERLPQASATKEQLSGVGACPSIINSAEILFP